MNKLFRFSSIQDAWDSRDEPESMRVLADALWRALLLLALVALLSSIWFGVQEMSVVSQTEGVAITSSPLRPPFTNDQLQSMLGFFSQRQSDYQALSQSPPPSIPDPSQ